MSDVPIDVILETDGYLVEVELPGVFEADINVTLRGARVTVHAERPGRAGNVVTREIERGLLVREILLPAAVELAGASFEDGLLRLRLRRSGG